jgi:thermostable 8-oxoguanine DNA glycosylase
MDKNKKIKFVFESAKRFINDIISKYPNLNNSVLEKHLEQESKFENILDANRRLIESLSNRNMMASVIGFNRREKEMQEILFGYNPTEILNAYKNPDELLDKFRNRFNLQKAQGKRSLWRKFSEGIISGSVFMATFKDKNDFDSFIKTFARNKYTKAALPMLLSKEVRGFGFALSCDFLKELGYRDYPKPDVHLIKIFHSLGLSPSVEPYEVYKSIVEMSEVVGEDAYTVDKIFWLIGSGKFYLVNVDTGRNREKFIKSVKAYLEKGFAVKEQKL